MAVRKKKVAKKAPLAGRGRLLRLRPRLARGAEYVRPRRRRWRRAHGVHRRTATAAQVAASVTTTVTARVMEADDADDAESVMNREAMRVIVAVAAEEADSVRRYEPIRVMVAVADVAAAVSVR